MPDTHAAHHTRAIWTALFVTVLWSSSWILIRVGLDDEALPPVTFAGLRYATAAIVLAGWVGARPGSRHQLLGLRRQLFGRLVLLGLVYFAITQGAQFVAIDAQPAATSSLMLAPTAFFVATLSGRSIGEAVTPRQIGGAVLVAVGAAVYFSGDLGATWVGMIASIIGLAANVAGSLMGRSVNRDAPVSPVIVTAVSMGVGAAVLLAIGVIVEGIPDISSRSAAIIGWLAVVNTALAFTLWNSAQRRLAAVETAAINNTMLVQIAALAWIFLGESAGPVGIAGIAIVSGGAFLAQAQRRHVPRTQA
jgi:drug/metabolite transporter (DMT)-like permease